MDAKTGKIVNKKNSIRYGAKHKYPTFVLL